MGRTKKEPHRMNLLMDHWAHKKLRVTAAEDMVHMSAVTHAAILSFSDLGEEARHAWYDEAAELNYYEMRDAGLLKPEEIRDKEPEAKQDG